jgi:hypothetical protein
MPKTFYRPTGGGFAIMGEATDSTGSTGLPTPEIPPAVQRPARAVRLGPGFAWGLATGTLAVVLIVGITVGASTFVAFSRFASLDGRTSSTASAPVIAPVKAGGPWFTVSDDGTGTLRGWNLSSFGTGGGPDGPSSSGEVAYFDVGALDVSRGVTIWHGVHVSLTRDTEIVIGGRQYGKGSAASPAEAIFNDDGSGGDILSGGLLTIEFHRVGSAIVADRISAPLERTTNPLQQ